ncbi:MAG TPA: hypothetical protein VHM00_08400 [Caldimonas sp.]|nr:hypothetical protein [Caldimonas sp.]
MDPSELRAIPVAERPLPAPWAEFGDEYEREVVAAYRRHGDVNLLGPAPGHDFLSDEASLAFLRGDLPSTAAYQLVLRGTSALHSYLRLEEVDVKFRRGVIDLILARQENGQRILRIVDIKSTHDALAFHKAQVAWYAWMLRGVIAENGLKAEIDPIGEIWHRQRVPTAPGVTWERSEFRLRSYESLIQDWASHELAEAARARVESRQDTTRFHIYFKCEGCKYLDHCGKAIRDGLPPEALDLSAIPGLTQQSKSDLHRRGIRTVRNFLDREGEILRGVSDWTLSKRGADLMARARAIATEVPQRIAGRVTLRMPATTHVKVLLVVDRDPMASRLAAIGARVVEDGKISEVIETIASAETEAGAVFSALQLVWNVLDRVHSENAEGATKILHLFVYEPAEALDLAEALGRNLDHPSLLTGLLDFIRMFPPEGVLPEPEYRGLHHLPASAIRTVLEDVYALPAKVSYDLRRVGRALSMTNPAPAKPYEPEVRFERPFSSRLALDVCRELEAGTVSREVVRDDVCRRLDSMEGLIDWLEATNSSLNPADRFLRLNKAPFQLQATVAPLGFRSLEVLRAQALLESYGALVATLHTLAQPTDRRIARQACIAGLRLQKWGSSPHGGKWLLFRVAPQSLDANVRPTDRMLLLTDGHPDRVLDRSRWPNFRVEWTVDPDRPPENLFLTISDEGFDSQDFQDLLHRLQGAEWVLDRGHFDVTSERLVGFLRHVDGDSGEA